MNATIRGVYPKTGKPSAEEISGRSVKITGYPGELIAHRPTDGLWTRTWTITDVESGFSVVKKHQTLADAKDAVRRLVKAKGAEVINARRLEVLAQYAEISKGA